MAEEQDGPDRDLENEIRQGRKFTAQEAIARMAGPGAMKGASPVSRHKQAEMAVGAWLKSNVADQTGALQAVLHRQVAASKPLQDSPEQPLAALAGIFKRLLASDELLRELVREADVEWGRRMDERPFFDKSGARPDPDDPYTIDAVHRLLDDALKKLTGPA